MPPFEYRRPNSLGEALALLDPDARAIAGGTELVNWLQDGIEAPARLVDIRRLPLAGIRRDGDLLRIGAVARLADIARDPTVAAEIPGLSQAIGASASAQIRHMGTLAGNLLQQTRCPYFRLPDAGTAVPCHLRAAGTGCAATGGVSRSAALLGNQGPCIATHPSDPAVVLAALDASVTVVGPSGSRSVDLAVLYQGAARSFGIARSELIVETVVPLGAVARSSQFLKLRDRSSFDFALVSGSAAVTEAGVRLVLGGVSWGPWRCHVAERHLAPGSLTSDSVREAMTAEFATAWPTEQNRFKLELATRLATRLLVRSPA